MPEKARAPRVCAKGRPRPSGGALRPGGELVILDFIREPGVSREWILEHVRAGEAVVTQEVTAAGFELVRREATPYLRENYVLRFRRG
jgi:hypothetical protein